ncbi:transglycosylase SLT domain-containing protein [Fusobacterium polymorphum]|uniref:transglycosylase SLT domain-containing protein n=1 Tax=Fusobacterium nucleatum subsp. polymorphum TaxID=76857 RepID=UPI00164D9B64|nr:transglycosylase SLT domain-containing protein [Fusobacterium polymorphum]
MKNKFIYILLATFVAFFYFIFFSEEKKSVKEPSFYINPEKVFLKIEDTARKEIEKYQKENELDILITHYCKKYDIDKYLIKAIAKVESNETNVIGDKHLKNHAYGFFQLRQPAINEINRIYNLNKINLAEGLIDNIDAQVEYTVLFIKHLKDNTKNEKEMISAYNIGLSNIKKGKYGKYYSKVLKARDEINKF